MSLTATPALPSPGVHSALHPISSRSALALTLAYPTALQQPSPILPMASAQTVFQSVPPVHQIRLALPASAATTSNLSSTEGQTPASAACLAVLLAKTALPVTLALLQLLIKFSLKQVRFQLKDVKMVVLLLQLHLLWDTH